jgi:LmbE family N-acetylglucosaminyl deacetylase
MISFRRYGSSAATRGHRSKIVIATALVSILCTMQGQVTPSAITLDATPNAQVLPEDRGAAGLTQTLRKLNSWASLMTIVAHPDDEDGGTLTYLSRGMGARTALLTLTRGEGGQNAISGETYDALGIMRTNELLRADEFYATTQYWGRVADYGFSKTIDEAFAQWGHDRVLYDAVRAVRVNRPLVVTSTFVGGITDGHGHHQVSGEMAQEVFKAAGDPTVFPDQIAAGLRPWSPLKVYSRVPFFSVTSKGMFDYATGKWAPARFYNYVTKEWSDSGPATNLEVPDGTYDPVLGRSYVQIARQGWGEQKSQNGGGFPTMLGPASVGYHRYASLVKTTDTERSFFDGIDTSLTGIATLAHGDTKFLKAALELVQRHVSTAMLGCSPAEPQKIAPELREGYLETKALIDAVNASPLSTDDKQNVNYELGIKLVQFNTALTQALGLELNAVVTSKTSADRPPSFGLTADQTIPAATPDMDLDVRLHVASAQPWSMGGKLQLTKTWLSNPDGETWPIERLGAPGLDKDTTSSGDVIFRVHVPQAASLTRPYFTRPNTEQPYYDIQDPRWLNQSFAPYPLAGWAEFNYDGVPLRLGQVVQVVRRIQGPGDIYQPLVVVPRLSVSIQPGAGIVPLGVASFPLAVKLRNSSQENVDGELRLDLPPSWTAEPATFPFHFKPNEDQMVSFTVHPAALAEQSYTLKAIARGGNIEYGEGYQTVGYTGLRPYNIYRPAMYRARGVDVKVARGLNVGYVMGPGDEVPAALESLGVHPHLLNAEEIATGDLSRFDVIMLGIRAYATRPELAANTRRILDYVQNGGTVIVQYNSSEYDHAYGPYPYVLGRSPEKVVDENAKVTLLEPNHPLFTWPNHITSEDFDGWVEERGHSFMESWNDHYAPLTVVHDPGQDPQRGGLLYAHYGKGTYIYAAYALYRQLPEAVPGAYRLLANLVSAGKNPTVTAKSGNQ